MIKIDFNNIRKIGDKQVLQFYTKTDKLGNIVEYAFLAPDDDYIHYIKADEGELTLPKNNLREFILDRYSEIEKELYGKSLLQKSEKSVPYLRLFLVRYKLPAIVYLGFTLGLKRTLELFNIQYHISSKRDPGAYLNIPIYLRDERKIISFYPKDSRGEMLLNGLKVWKVNNAKFQTLDDRKPFEELIKTKLSQKAVKDLQLFEDKIIDPITAEYLKQNGLPTQFSILLATHMTDKLFNAPVENPNDIRNARIRLSEAVADIVYAQLMMAARAAAEGTKDKVVLDPKYIINQLMQSGLVHYTKSLSPLDELAQTRKVTKSGVGNMKAELITLQQRDFGEPKKIYGVMSPTHTHEYSKIGAVHSLVASPNFKNRYGEVESKNPETSQEAHDVISVSEILSSPFLDKNDQTRNIMGAQQASQYLELNNPDIPHAQTGYEALAPHVVSERFAKKSPCDGKITKIEKDKYIEVTCNDGQKHIINVQPVRSRTKRGVYINKNYKIIVKDGQKVKTDDILAVSPSLQHGMITPGKNAVIAVMNYKGHNFEDGFVVTEEFLGRFKYNELEKVTVIVTNDAVVEYIEDQIGKETKQGDVLVKFKHQKHFDEVLSDIEEKEASSVSDSENYEDVFKGLKNIRRGETEYVSPGGKIVDIVVRLNTEKGLNDKVKKLYNKMVKHLKENEELCAKTYKKGTKGFIDCAYSHENNIMLKIGGHKINNIEPDGAIIEYYIQREATGDQSSKIVIGAYGQKGTVQAIIPKGQEPIAKETGLKIDLIISPLSIFARKALATLTSIYAGKVTWALNEKCKQLAEKGDEKGIYKLAKQFYSMIDKTNDGRILEAFESSWNPKEAIKELKSRDPIRQPYFPFIGTPFVNKVTINDIEEVAKFLNVPLNEKVYIPDGDYSTDTDVPVGITTVLMTEHIPSSMANASTMAKKSKLTGQGKAGAKMGMGALGIGQYDIGSITSAGKDTANIIKELSIVRSDDKQAEKTFVKKIIKEGKPVKLDEIPTAQSRTKQVVDAYLIAAGIAP